jgi:hypothetical protein
MSFMSNIPYRLTFYLGVVIPTLIGVAYGYFNGTICHYINGHYIPTLMVIISQPYIIRLVILYSHYINGHFRNRKKWRYRFHIFLAYFFGLLKGISPQNIAKNMVLLTYLHFRILKLHVIIICHYIVPYMVILYSHIVIFI